LGQHIWTCVYKNGETYTIVEAATELKSHNMAYIAAETVKPDFDNTGRAYIRCLNDGCTKYETLDLPKLVIDSNAFIVHTDANTGVKTIIYSFKFPSTYNFEPITIYYYVNAHVHNYDYKLEPNNGVFDLVGRCSGWDCDQLEVRIVDVEVSYMNTSTCTQFGESIWIHFADDGASYTFALPSFELGDHSYSYDESELVRPDFDNEGWIACTCTNEDCTYSFSRVLPKVSVGNTKSVGYDSSTKIRTLKYTYTYGTFVYEFELTMFDDHIHEYTTTLEPYDRKFDLITRCNSLFCDSEMRDSAVDAVLVEDYYSCVEEGYQVWQYEKDGILYECTIRINIYGHFMTMTYDEHADTTVIPDFENGGSVLVYCDFCGEQISYVDLPKAQLNVNTIVVEETNEYVKYEYTYVYEGLLIISFDIVVTK
ncbi:MAG: hypothetical protein IKW53_03410, partial [Clostridia bacterium]|nr:hypothetical protein [Clostridia bacterium]